MVTGDRAGLIQLWRRGTDTPVDEWEAHEAALEAIRCVGPDHLLTAGGDGAVRLWDTGSQSLVSTFARHSAVVAGLSVAPSGTLLVSGGYDGLVHVCDVASSIDPMARTTHGTKVVSVAIRDDHTVAFGGIGSEAVVWTPGEDQAQTVLEGHDRAVVSLGFAPTDAVLVTVDHAGTVRWWDTELWAEQDSFRLDAAGEYPIAVSTNQVAVGTDSSIELFDMRGAHLGRIAVDVGVTAVDLDPTGGAVGVVQHDGSIIEFTE